MFGPYTNLSLIASPYTLHKAVLVICANVNWVKMDFEFFVDNTVLIVLSGLPDSTIKRPDANRPNAELTCSNDLFVSANHVHKLMVTADSPTTMFWVVCSCAPLSSGKTVITYQILAIEPGTFESVTNGSLTDKPYTSQQRDDTAIIAKGTGFRSSSDSFVLACRTVVKGEKYRRVLVNMPMRGTRVVTSELAGVISKAVPPLTDNGLDSATFFALCLLMPSLTLDVTFEPSDVAGRPGVHA